MSYSSYRFALNTLVDEHTTLVDEHTTLVDEHTSGDNSVG